MKTLLFDELDVKAKRFICYLKGSNDLFLINCDEYKKVDGLFPSYHFYIQGNNICIFPADLIDEDTIDFE